MKTGELLRDGFTAISRRVPQVRGFGRICLAVNGLSLRLGAPRIVEAPMADGSQMSVDLTTNTELWAYYYGHYNQRIVTLIRDLLEVDKEFLDVGANVGFITVAVGMHIKKQGGSGAVRAFEPFQGNYDRLLKNIAQNDLSMVCHAYQFGLSDQIGHAELTLREDFHAGSQTGNAAIATTEEFDRGFQRVQIALISLDEWMRQTDAEIQVDMVKVDIEGHEDFFLRGAQGAIEKCRPTIIMEVNKPYYEARQLLLDEVFPPLIPTGYQMFRNVDARWRAIRSFDECARLDDVVLAPEEKLSKPVYARYFCLT